MLLRDSCIVFLLNRGSLPSQLVLNSLSNPLPAEASPDLTFCPSFSPLSVLFCSLSRLECVTTCDRGEPSMALTNAEGRTKCADTRRQSCRRPPSLRPQ